MLWVLLLVEVFRPIGRICRNEGRTVRESQEFLLAAATGTQTSAQGVVHQGEGPVRGVHHPVEVDIRRNVNLFFIGAGIRQGKRVLATTLVSLHQHEQFAEDLAEIAPVDLIDDEHVTSSPGPTRLGCRSARTRPSFRSNPLAAGR